MINYGKKPIVIPTGAAIALTTIFCSLAIASVMVIAQDKPEKSKSRTSDARRTEAKIAYESICASCHGLDARGAERGPDIVSRPDIVRKTDAELVKTLVDGRAAEGMPSFASYGPAKLSALVAYLRTLQGHRKETPLPGDPARGKDLFFGKAKCAECHMVSGQGGFFAQDLTAYAARTGAEAVLAAIVNPSKNLDPRRGLVTVTLVDSTTLFGIARNEDNFSIQLQTPDGVFHLLNKSEIRALTYAGRSPMPSDYGAALSSMELNDLVSFLLHVSQSEKSAQSRSSSKDEDEE